MFQQVVFKLLTSKNRVIVLTRYLIVLFLPKRFVNFLRKRFSQNTFLRSVLKNYNLDFKKILMGEAVKLSLLRNMFSARGRRYRFLIRRYYDGDKLLHEEIARLQKVLFITRDIPLPTHAGSYLRLHRIFEITKDLGFSIEVLHLNSLETTSRNWNISLDYLDEIKSNYLEAKIACKQATIDSITEGLYPIWCHEVNVAYDFIQNFGVFAFPNKLILDTVDLEFRRLEQQNSPKELIAESIERLHFVASIANVVIAISEIEAGIIKELSINENVSVLSNIYIPEIQAKNGLSDTFKVLFLGNFLHFPNIDALEYLNKDIARLDASIQYVVAGGHLTNIPTLSNNVEYLGHIESLHDIYKSINVVIAPLRIGAGVKGKVLEALYRGIPVVGTDIAWEGIPFENGITGLRVNSPEEFVEAIQKIKLGKVELKPDITKLDMHFGIEYAKMTLRGILSK